jgi:hypothetical protein
MANHAKVCTGKSLNPEEVNEIVQRINKKKFGGIFTIDFQIDVERGWGKYQWILNYKDTDYIGMVFWLSDDASYGYEEDGKWIDSDDKTILSKQSCIEFRHGHSFRFMWWVEGVFRENLGKHYNAKMWDDGIGECEPANPKKYETFKSYLTSDEEGYDKNVNKEKLKQWKDFEFGLQKDAIPVELINALNLDFEI